MKTRHIAMRNHHRLQQSWRLIVLLIAVALVGINASPSRVAARSSGAQSAIVLQTLPTLNGMFSVVDAGPGDQFDPHVDCDLASYTTGDPQTGVSQIRYFDLATNTDHLIPGNGADSLSSLSGSFIALTEGTISGSQVAIFDTATQTRTTIPGYFRSRPALGGNLVAFEDRSFSANANESEIGLYDLSTGTVTRLTNDALFNRNPAVSPTGNVVVWEKCQTNGLGCDIYSAVQTGPGTFQTTLLTGAGEDRGPATNGTLVVYVSDKSGGNDIYYQPVGGGVETHLSIPGDQRDVSISGNLIAFESSPDGLQYDIYVYDIAGKTLYQVTSTPVNETLSDISVCNGVGRIVYGAPGNGYDIYAFTFQLPSSTPDQINDLIALVQSFNLPDGIQNSLITKLQDALAAISASDTATACVSLTAFISETQAQSGKKLTADQASQLINSANQIKTSLGCP